MIIAAGLPALRAAEIALIELVVRKSEYPRLQGLQLTDHLQLPARRCHVLGLHQPSPLPLCTNKAIANNAANN